jgi:hypothetical protein
MRAINKVFEKRPEASHHSKTASNGSNGSKREAESLDPQLVPPLRTFDDRFLESAKVLLMATAAKMDLQMPHRASGYHHKTTTPTLSTKTITTPQNRFES